MPPSLWTEQQDDILRREWPRGDAASMIATLLPGKSRNAVIGRAHRLKLGKRLEFGTKTIPKNTPGSGKNKTPRKRNRKKGGSTPQEGAMAILSKVTAPIRIPANKPLTNKPPISILELGKNTCRAIVGHGPNRLAVYCGDQTFADKSFCEGHCALFFDYERKRRYR